MGVLEVNTRGIIYAPHTARYRLKRIDHWFKEKECPRCGKKEVLVPYPGYVVLCPNCFRRWAHYEDMKLDGRAQPFLSTTGAVRCMECGAWHPVMWYVRPGWLCPRCIWKLGGGRGPLKTDGVRW